MNPLSSLSIIICTCFCIGAGRFFFSERRDLLNKMAAAVLLSLGWWSFCNAFFYASPNAESAFFWHRFAAIGWCGFVSLTAYYFYVLTNPEHAPMAGWKRVLFFTPGLLLILKNLLGPTTSLALSVIPSMSGLGWTYTNSLTSFWLWAFLGYVLIYFSYAFYLLHLWARNVHHRMKKRLAYTFILLDTLTIAIGVITDVILPLTVPVLPSLASIATAFFGLGYFGIIYRYDLFNIDLIISPDTILQTSNNPIFVIDEKTEILKCNDAAGCLLGYDAPLLLGYHLSRFLRTPSI